MEDDCSFLGERITPDSQQVNGISIKLWCKRPRTELDSQGLPFDLPCFDCGTGLPMCEGYVPKRESGG